MTESTTVVGGFTTVLKDRHFLEGPRWRDGRIWVSDFHAHEVLSANADGTDVRVEAELNDLPSGLGWLPDGRLLVVSMADRAVLRREHSGELVVHADLSSFSDADFNDMLVDADGRAYVGSTGFDSNIPEPVRTAPVVLIQPDGSASIAADDLYMPNGMTMVTDGVLVVAETLGNRLSAFDVAADGTLGPRRDWARFGSPPVSDDLMEVMPGVVVGSDGIVSDSEGAIWVADALKPRVIRVAEGGEILQEISTEALGMGAYSCTLGGPDGRTLFICAAPDFYYAARAAAAEAVLLSVTVDVPA
ncbi:SMP-30/gluconolactonase/LRE family protein [Georgenia sp. SYP-B2076]|uniref:SMP-30/gluconolactonase/LRE family protein n=1 Tax=Georgenia sp. SYP-B2076 TaxID=2495881 RepID=UPI000F8CDEC3|nr:SMP-30/gluconolactonase/LRE family protein [Georgenia sp. SYP-B2076]